jgi:type II secretory pathway predicted ATPase ExeA
MEVPKTDRRIAQARQLFDDDVVAGHRYGAASLQDAGRADTLFSDDAIALIHNASRGHPRAVNNLALHALTAAFATDHAIVDEKAARVAISENAAD